SARASSGSPSSRTPSCTRCSRCAPTRCGTSMNEDGTAGGGGTGPGDGRRRRRRPRRRPRGPRGPGGPIDGNGSQGPNPPWNAPAPGAENGSFVASGAEIGARAPDSGAVAESNPANGADPRAEGFTRPEGERRQEGGGGWQPGQYRGRGGRPQGGRGRGHGRPQRANHHRGRRGRTGENWWARRWVEVLERFAVGRRLGRGSNYARQGHIVDIEIGKGFVTAHVQGSRDAPYLVRMHFSMLSSTDWKKLTRALAHRPDIAVELGMGQIPESIEQVFEEQRLSLFPNASGDLKAACSCPDNANPRN